MSWTNALNDENCQSSHKKEKEQEDLISTMLLKEIESMIFLKKEKENKPPGSGGFTYEFY